MIIIKFPIIHMLQQQLYIQLQKQHKNVGDDTSNIKPQKKRNIQKRKQWQIT